MIKAWGAKSQDLHLDANKQSSRYHLFTKILLQIFECKTSLPILTNF